MGAISVMPIMENSPKYVQKYLPSNQQPKLTDDDGNPLPLKYGDPIYGQGDRNNPSQIIGRVGMAPVVSGGSRDGQSISWADDPAYQKPASLIDIQAKVASGQAEASGTYGKQVKDSGLDFSPISQQSAYTSYDPSTNTVKYYDTQGNLTSQGQQTKQGLGFLGDTITGALGQFNKNDLGPLTLLTMAGMGGAGLMADTGGFAGLNTGIDFGAATPAAGTSLSNLAAAGGGDALTAAVGGGGAAPAALTPAAIESGLGTAGYGVNASAVNSGLFNPATIGAGAGIGAAAMPAAGLSQAAINEAVASGNAPNSLGSALGQYLPADAAAAAAGTTGIGSALYDLSSLGNINALNNLLNPSQTAANNTGNTNNGLSGTQLAALGTGAAGLYNASATREAMQQAIGAQQALTAASQGTLGNIYNQQLGYQAPYQAAGVGAVNQLAGMTPYLTHQFNAADLQAGLAPNYDFMLQQGQQANQRAANVGGGALGGNALTGLNQYTQNYAGNAYQNAFNNYQSQRQNIYSDLAGIAGIGQTANTGAGTAGTNYAQGTVGLNTGLANAQAANILGQAQVGAGGVTNAANTAFLATLLGQNTPTTGTPNTQGTAGGTSGMNLGQIANLGTTIGNAASNIGSGISGGWNYLSNLF